MSFWPVSQRYLDTLARSHTQVGYIEILRDGEVFLTLQAGYAKDPNTGAPVFALGGSVNVSRNMVRRQGTVTLLDPTGQLTPYGVDDLFAPYVTEIRLWVGVRYWDARPLPVDEAASWQTTTQSITIPQQGAGTASSPVLGASAGSSSVIGSTYLSGSASAPAATSQSVTVQIPILPTYLSETEYVPVGTMVVTHIETDYPQITLTCYDRMWYCDQFVRPYTVTKGIKVVDAIQTLLNVKVPSSILSTNFWTMDDVLSQDLVFDSNSSVQDALAQIASVAGIQVYTDQLGTFVFGEEPSTDDDDVITYSTGARSMLYRVQRTIGGDQPYNAVVYTSESASTIPVRGYAEDDNPRSLTYVNRVGIHPYFASSSVLSTQDQLDTAARALLRSLLGLTTTFSVPIIPNYAFDVSDVFRAVDSLIGLDAKLITDSFAVPLRASDGIMTMACRSNVANVTTTPVSTNDTGTY